MKNQKKALVALLVLVVTFSFAFTGCGGEKDKAAKSDEVINWSFYSPYGPQDSACCEIWANLFKEVEKATEGRLVITTYWSGQHPYEGSDMLRVVDEGTAELAHFYGGFVSSVEPALGVDSLPLIFPTDTQEAWDINSSLWGGFAQDTNGPLESILEERWNASMIHMVPGTSQRLMTSGYDAGTTNSLKGHKVRVYSAEFGKFVEALGGTPVSLSSSEVYTALATNLIDSAITSVVFADQGGYFDYVDTINMWEISKSSDGLMVSMEALNSLPEDIKEIFTKIMYDSATLPELQEVEDNDKRVESLVVDGKAKVVTPTEADRAEITEVVKKSIWEPWVKELGKEGQDIIKYIEDMQKKSN